MQKKSASETPPELLSPPELPSPPAASPSDYSLDSILTSELRFFIMAILAMYREVDFNFLKKELEVSDGNLSANLTKLEDAGYLVSKKEFVGKRPHTTYRISSRGFENLQTHLRKMEQVKSLIDSSGKGAD